MKGYTDKLLGPGETSIRVRCHPELLELCEEYKINVSEVTRLALFKEIRKEKVARRKRDFAFEKSLNSATFSGIVARAFERGTPTKRAKPSLKINHRVATNSVRA